MYGRRYLVSKIEGFDLAKIIAYLYSKRYFTEIQRN